MNGLTFSKLISFTLSVSDFLVHSYLVTYKSQKNKKKKKVLQAVGNLSEREGIFCGLEGLVVCDHLVLGEEETTISLVATQM